MQVALRRIARGLAQDPDAQRVLADEARIWRALRHPNIVTVLDLGWQDADWFLVLELVEGATVDEVLRALGPMPIPEALCVAHRIALALGAAHELRIDGKALDVVHRDVKPANLLLGENGEVKLTDFGIARATDRLGRTAAGIVKGSLHFLAPEQVRKDPLDARTDLFALGCSLHTMLSCRPLIDLPKDHLLRVLARGDIPTPPLWMPAKIRSLLATLTAADPAHRPPTAAAAAELIAEALSPATPASIEAALGNRVSRFRAVSGSWPDAGGSCTQ